jgi:hypothetical protein
VETRRSRRVKRMMGYLCEFQCGYNLSAVDKKTGQCLAGIDRRAEK